MSGRRRNDNKYKPLTFESAGSKNGKTDTYSAIYKSMLFHPAYTSLKPRPRALYTYCKEKYYGHRKPQTDFPDVPELQGNKLFYFSLSDAVATGLYTQGMRNEFYGDMRVLEDHGLIRKVVSGKSTKRKSIYEFSNKWQTWEGR